MNNIMKQQQMPIYNNPALVVADAAESSLTFNSPVPPTRKRTILADGPRSQPFDVASSCFMQQQMEIDCLISFHMEKLKAEVRRRRSSLLHGIALAVECRLKSKDNEIEQLRQLNAALEERVRALAAENQIWRDVAQSHEATAQTLRHDLETAILQQQQQQLSWQRHGTDDAESCCDNGDNTGERRVCRTCGKEAASVLVLPCRHLCLCSVCASKTMECALCGCSKQCTIHVNLCS